MLQSPRLVTFLIFLVAILNIAGLATGLYWRFSWYGYAVHALGGFAVASLGGFLLARRSGSKAPLGRSLQSLFLVSFTALAGVLWEFFEFVLSQLTVSSFPGRIQLSIGETMGDLAFDLVGGVLFFLFTLF